MKKPELISPAGDIEKLKIAFQYGADAVYASTPEFSMRSRGENKFDYKTLEEGIKYAHSINKKVYLTINTFEHSTEIDKLKEHIFKVINLNPDAIIAADPGVIKFIQNHTIIPIHLSTQANTTNHLSAEFWKKEGIKRIVLARELNLKDIKIISEHVKVELEAFVHGAMCMAYSGRCQISNYMTGRDANKGACIQACRFKYRFQEIGLEEDLRKGEKFSIYEDEKGSYILNSKDLCMVEHIPDLMKSGLSSFKIEGRLKSIYYVGMVTRAYRQAIDLYFENPEKYQLEKEKLLRDLCKTSNRGFTTGFYFQKPDQNTNDYDTSRAGSDYSFVGLVKKCQDNILYVEARNRIRSGSKVEIITPGCSYKHTITEMKDKDGANIQTAHAGYMISFKIGCNVPENSFIICKDM